MSVSKDTSGRLQAIAVRNIEFFRPTVEDIPWQLLAAGSASHTAEELTDLLDLDYARVANRIEPATIIGIYALIPRDAERFDFLSVSVAAEFQSQLVGRRLLGHALGLAESKAAREVYLNVCAANVRALDTAQRYGFERLSPASRADAPDEICELRFELTPE